MGISEQSGYRRRVGTGKGGYQQLICHVMPASRENSMAIGFFRGSSFFGGQQWKFHGCEKPARGGLGARLMPASL